MPESDYWICLAVWVFALGGVFFLLIHFRRRRRQFGRSLRAVHTGLALVLLLATLTVPEVLFALFYDTTDSFSQTNVSRRWFARHVHPNRAGYRDVRELPSTREPGVKYIGFVGDSFTFGHGVKNVADRFTDRVAADLERNEPRRTQVFNAALPGTEIRVLTDQLAPELVRTTPIDVLVYVFVPNDIEYLDERTAAFYQAQQAGVPRFFLFRGTYFYNWLYYRLRGVVVAGRDDYYGYLADAYTGPPGDHFVTKLDQLRDLCREHRIELRVVLFPFLTSLGNADPFEPGYERLIAHCKESDLPCLDLRPVLLPHRSEGLTVNRFDAHPNERAHQLAASAITEWLLKSMRSQ